MSDTIDIEQWHERKTEQERQKRWESIRDDLCELAPAEWYGRICHDTSPYWHWEYTVNTDDVRKTVTVKYHEDSTTAKARGHTGLLQRLADEDVEHALAQIHSYDMRREVLSANCSLKVLKLGFAPVEAFEALIDEAKSSPLHELVVPGEREEG